MNKDFALAVAKLVFAGEKGQLMYLGDENTLLTEYLKDRYSVEIIDEGYLEEPLPRDCIVYAPSLTPQKPIYKTIEKIMDNHSIDHITAVVPWLVLINGEYRTRKMIEWGLIDILHLPRRALSGSSVQVCVLIMHRGYRGKIEFSMLKVE
jgi:hypothetical protein